MAAQNKTYKHLLYIFIISVLFINNTAIAQSNYLYRKINVSFSDVTLGKGLTKISDAGGFTFSYNSKNFDNSRLISLNAQNKTVVWSLNQIFDNTVKYKVVGSHVILIKKNPTKTFESNIIPNEYIISGYVIDSRTGQKIKEATIYEVNNRIVTISNSDGFYTLTVPANKDFQGLNYSKSGYLDTVIMVRPAYKNSVDIYLNPREIPLEKLESKYVKLEDFHRRPMVNILVPNESKIISDNLVIHDTKLAQVSLIPFIGTNRKLSGSVDNTLSLNVLAGYSGGVNGFEIGGLLNIVRRDVHGSQISGVANIVGGNTKPFQLAGFFNLNSGSVTGTQISGFSNVVLDTLNGVQLAGFNNTLHGYMNGVQISGFNNVTTQNVDGIQLTGFVNVAVKDVKLGQISGFANYCDNVNGGQISGFANYAKGDVNWGQLSGFANYGKSVKGMQISGFANISANEVAGGQLSGGFNYGESAEKYQISGFANIAKEEIEGFQLAGYLNYAKKVNGYQIALVNISDTIESGMPIGIFSFVKKGFHRIEIYTNEIFYLNAAYKLGVKKFYNTIRVGYNFSNNLYVGYGLGTQKALSKNFNLNLDFTSDVIFDSSSFKALGDLDKISISFDYNFNQHISIYAGPTINLSRMEENNNNFPSIAPYSFYKETFSDTQAKMWVGGIFGLSFTL